MEILRSRTLVTAKLLWLSETARLRDLLEVSTLVNTSPVCCKDGNKMKTEPATGEVLETSDGSNVRSEQGK